SLSETKTVVTSRLLQRSGILNSVSVRQGQARITTTNDLYDPLTGGALLASSDNAFGAPIYTYTVPARWTYPRMGAAYQDVGLRVDLANSNYNSNKTVLSKKIPPNTIPACPDASGSTPVAPCLSIGAELGFPTPSGGIHLTLVRSTDVEMDFAVD